MDSVTQTSAAPAAPDWRALLKARGLRVTRQRLAVLSSLHDAGHLMADEIARAIPAVAGPEAAIALPSVYAVLGDLERADLVRKVDLGTGRALFETRVGDNHHHAVCRTCGRVDDVPCAVGHAPCLDPQSTDMRIEVADVVFRGLCHDCATAANTAQPAVGHEDSTMNGVNHD
ncbi:Fur family transcriptional regulator [Falsarthrobacter nasiphocae]|uniref:Fe2+ or Zn2+ uptake regulation protein n=1 Tax=Falsarthrobacter nasiphocae TaxID=189863 RepID=A0AAE3YHW8_9MICC|nr:Fur family transcriptional regulator [Falsarthrobacter nasiphocae]MDR6892459.1 Fe2+ or Zn2+ uptake regulation protein [Falsarthrobacter nasiphocae]